MFLLSLSAYQTILHWILQKLFHNTVKMIIVHITKDTEWNGFSRY